MSASDARPVPRKNTAFRAYFPLLDKSGALVSGAAGLDSERSIDGAAFADCTNEATEIGSSGTYYLDLTAAEMNGDAVVVIVKTSTTDAKTTTLVFYPEEAGDYRSDVVSFGGTAGTFSGGRPEVNASHAGGTAWGSGAITAGSIAAGAITNVKFAAGAIDAAAIAADAIGASELAADAATEIANATWALDATGQQTQGSFGQAVGDPTTGGSIISRLPNATPGAAGGVFIAGANAATSISTSFTTTFTGNLTGSVGSVTGNVGGNVTGSVGSVTGLTASNLDATISSRLASAAYTVPPTAAANADAVWDEAMSGHVTVGTFGQTGQALRAGTAQDGSGATITLDAGASAIDAFYNGQIVKITGGTGAGQARNIVNYTGSTKVADLFYAWQTAPDNTSQFVIVESDMRLNTSSISYAVWDYGVPQSHSAGTAAYVLNSAASAGDPWGTALPGAYGAGTAGSKIGRIPDVAAGSAGGLFIAGTNAATTANITGNITGNLSGSVGSVTGAVGSVTGNVGGNVTGSVGSVATGGITNASLATDAISASKVNADVGAEYAATILGTAVPGAFGAGTLGSRIGKLPDVTAGASGGCFIAGTNAATSVTTSFTTTFTGNLTGSVASVTGAVGSVTGAVGSVTGLTASNLDATVSSRLAPTTAGRTLDVTATGEAGIDWANIGGPTTAQTLSGTTVGTATSVGTVNALAANVITAASIATDAIDADALAASAVDEILDEVIEGTYTLRQMMRLVASTLASKVSGAGTTTITFRDIGDSKNRIVATVDADGNRSSLTLDVT